MKLKHFFAPAHVLPLNVPPNIRTVLAVHDLVSVHYPKTMANYNRFIHNIYFKPFAEKLQIILLQCQIIQNNQLSIISAFRRIKSR
jgi:hypothetical protein